MALAQVLVSAQMHASPFSRGLHCPVSVSPACCCCICISHPMCAAIAIGWAKYVTVQLRIVQRYAAHCSPCKPGVIHIPSGVEPSTTAQAKVRLDHL